jgi:IS5 family transposase
MKPIKTTLFITGAILVSMILASLKVQAQTVRLTQSQKVECEIQYYHQTHVILENLAAEIASNNAGLSDKEKIHDVERAQVKAEIFEGRTGLSESECEEHLMDAEMKRKGQSPSASQD